MLLAMLETYAEKGEETLYVEQARQGTRGNLAVPGRFVGAYLAVPGCFVGACSGFWQKPELSAEFWIDLERRKLKLISCE